MKIKKCRNCQSKNLSNLFSLGKISFTGKFSRSGNIKKAPLRLSICFNCDLVQLSDNYNLKYLYGPDYGYRTGINQTMTSHVKNIVKKLQKKIKIKKKDAVLDVASNDGTLLNFYNRNVIKFGIDPILNKYRDQYININYKIANFFSLKKILNIFNKKFKIITALSVFYDLKDPNKFLHELEKIITYDGIILIEFADLNSILKYNMFDAICHEHLAYYSSKIMISMCNNNNLKIIDIKKNNINGGSTQYYIAKKNSEQRINKKKIDKILKNENNFVLNKKKTFIDFFQKIEKIKFQLLNIIRKAKINNKIIHGYGASTKGNVLLQYFQLDKRHIDFIADRNPKKFGLLTPGSKIKIISEKISRKIKPNYYIVLPWHFKEEILKREIKTLNKGSKFIFPLPRVKIYKAH
jgi:2-polyprenyl-3-methyl-5-hydroxy-6-metoxy-1,4-benzoquinol methylase